MIEPGTVVGGRYRLVKPAWFDSEAYTWRALDTRTGEDVHVRVPARPDDFAVASFQRQYDLLSTIDHPGVVRVRDIGRDPTVVIYLVTEYFESVWKVDGGPVAPERAMDVVVQAADALQAVHDRGVVFRNILKGLMTRADGTEVLNDFHLVVPVGSPELEHIVSSYAAFWDSPATPLTDIYDLGRLAHYLMTLVKPRGLLKRLDPLVWPDHVPPEVRAVVDKAVAINPADRWPSAAALAEAARRGRAPGTAGT
jgi:serine/threonine-protein kinase